jgi:hypothetical protein
MTRSEGQSLIHQEPLTFPQRWFQVTRRVRGNHIGVGVLRASVLELKRLAAPEVDGLTGMEYEDGLEGRLCDHLFLAHRRTARSRQQSGTGPQ